MQKSKQIQRHVGCSINATYMVISRLKNKYFVLLYFHRNCDEILTDCHCRCFHFVVSFKTICYLLKSSKKCEFYQYFNHLFYRELFVYICMQRNNARRIQQRCFIYRSIFAIPALRKRRVPCSLRSLPF